METKTAKSYGYRLLKQLPKGTTLYTILRRVSRSGMTRVIDVKVLGNGTFRDAVVQEFRNCARDCKQELKWGGNYRVTGCGMDMGFWLVYELGYLVHKDGYYFRQSWL